MVGNVSGAMAPACVSQTGARRWRRRLPLAICRSRMATRHNRDGAQIADPEGCSAIAFTACGAVGHAINADVRAAKNAKVKRYYMARDSEEAAGVMHRVRCSEGRCLEAGESASLQRPAELSPAQLCDIVAVSGRVAFPSIQGPYPVDIRYPYLDLRRLNVNP